jgi:hypothetical protein
LAEESVIDTPIGAPRWDTAQATQCGTARQLIYNKTTGQFPAYVKQRSHSFFVAPRPGETFRAFPRVASSHPIGAATRKACCAWCASSSISSILLPGACCQRKRSTAIRLLSASWVLGRKARLQTSNWKARRPRNRPRPERGPPSSAMLAWTLSVYSRMPRRADPTLASKSDSLERFGRSGSTGRKAASVGSCPRRGAPYIQRHFAIHNEAHQHTEVRRTSPRFRAGGASTAPRGQRGHAPRTI